MSEREARRRALGAVRPVAWRVGLRIGESRGDKRVAVIALVAARQVIDICIAPPVATDTIERIYLHRFGPGVLALDWHFGEWGGVVVDSLSAATMRRIIEGMLVGFDMPGDLLPLFLRARRAAYSANSGRFDWRRSRPVWEVDDGEE